MLEQIMESYVYLLSNDSTDHYKNVLSKFSNNIPLSIAELQAQRCRVALQAISVNASVPKDYKPKLIHICVDNITEDFHSGNSRKLIHTIPFPKEDVRILHVAERKTFF